MGTATKTRKTNKNGYKNDVIIPIQSLCNLIDVKMNGKTIRSAQISVGKKSNSAIICFTDGSSTAISKLLGANVVITDDRTQIPATAVSADDDDDDEYDDDDENED